MMIPTHRMVGNYLYRHLSRSDKKKINKNAFIWGNVKPDILRKYKRISHYHPANEAFVFQLIDELLELNMTIRDFSANLGVLIHFLCDYTCVFHNNMQINRAYKMRQHMYYEALLHGYAIRKMKKAQPCVINLPSKTALKNYILAVIHRANLEGVVPDMMADFHAMMEMSVSVMAFMLFNYSKVSYSKTT